MDMICPPRLGPLHGESVRKIALRKGTFPQERIGETLEQGLYFGCIMKTMDAFKINITLGY